MVEEWNANTVNMNGHTKERVISLNALDVGSLLR